MRVLSIVSILATATLVSLAGPASGQWSDNFDSYAAGSLLEGQGGWTHWNNAAAGGGQISNSFAASAPNSTAIAAGSDSVQEFMGLNSGSFLIRADVYTPTSFVGKSYLIVLNKYNVSGGAYEWGIQFGLNGDTDLVECDCGLGTPSTIPLVRDQWVEFRAEVDLDLDTASIYYNGTFLATYPWSGGVFGADSFNTNRIRAINLYADNVNFPGVTELYVDNFEVTSTGGAIGTNYCISNANSTGQPALMSASGSPVVAAANFHLTASPVPNQPGIFYYGPNQSMLAFGNGFRCVSGFTSRLGVVNASGNALSTTVDFANPPTVQGTIMAGSTWNFQAWFRDPPGGGAFFDLSDGLEVMFQ